MIYDNGINRGGKNVSANNMKHDPDFNFPGRKRKLNELYSGDDLSSNMNSRIKLEKNNDKSSADKERERLTSEELSSTNYNTAQNEMKVNINSNGLVNHSSFLKNKQVKPVEANGSPMNFVKNNEDKFMMVISK